MSLWVHSAIRVETYHFEGDAARHVMRLGATPEAYLEVARTAPYGITRCYIGVGGYFCESERRRGFAGPMPRHPTLIEADHANLYLEELGCMSHRRQEDLALAACAGTLTGAALGLAGAGIGYALGGDLWLTAIPFSLMVPCGLGAWLKYASAYSTKQRRLECLSAMVEGLYHPTHSEMWRQAQAIGIACRDGSDPLLRLAAEQFFSAKEEMLPRYNELGTFLPAYAPPDDDTPLAVLRAAVPPRDDADLPSYESIPLRSTTEC